MPYAKIEEGFFDTSDDQLDSIVECFANAAMQISKTEVKGRAALFWISRYVGGDPYRDVLPETQSLFFRKELHGANGDINREEFSLILQKIKNLYFIMLPAYTLQRHRDSLDIYFTHINEYVEKFI